MSKGHATLSNWTTGEYIAKFNEPLPLATHSAAGEVLAINLSKRAGLREIHQHINVLKTCMIKMIQVVRPCKLANFELDNCSPHALI